MAVLGLQGTLLGASPLEALANAPAAAPRKKNKVGRIDEDLVILISDLHCNPEWYQPGYLKRVVSDIVSMTPLPGNVVALGDLAFMVGAEGDYRLLKEILAPLEEAGIHVTLGMGNHDRRDTFARVFPERVAASELRDRIVHVVRTPKADIILLDSLQQHDNPEKYIGKGAISQAQKEWLTQTLATYTDRPVLVAAHHPLEELDIKKILLDCPRCGGYLYGHNHKWDENWTYRSFRSPGTLRTLCVPSTGNNGDIGYVALRFLEDHAEARLHEYEYFFPRPLQEGQVKPLEWRLLEADRQNAVCRMAYLNTR